MLTLCLDTAYKYLTCALIEDDKIVFSYSEECFKRQSEEIFVVLEDMLQKTNKRLLDIDSICITSGPGSYTGVRIAMTIAKVLASLADLKLYSISTLRLYANMQANTLVLLDARANRAYVGIYDKVSIIMDDTVLEIDKIDATEHNVLGDGHLIALEDKMPDISEAFLNTKAIWQEVKDIEHLVPVYLKESESYLK